MNNGVVDSDNAFGRIMGGNNFGGTTNTVESCISTCSTNNFTLAGTEYGSE